MANPFRVSDADDPGTDMGGWDEDGNIDIPGNFTGAGEMQVGPNAAPVPFAEFGPQDHGFMTWNADIWMSTGAVALVAGTVYLQRLPIRQTCTPTKMSIGVTVGATTPTAGQCWAGVYSATGVRLAQTDIETEIAGSGEVSFDMTPGELAAGTFVWAALLVNAAALPQLSRFSSSSTIPNAGPGQAAGTFRSCVNGTGQTTLPSPLTVANNTVTGQLTLWTALWG